MTPRKKRSGPVVLEAMQVPPHRTTSKLGALQPEDFGPVMGFYHLPYYSQLMGRCEFCGLGIIPLCPVARIRAGARENIAAFQLCPGCADKFVEAHGEAR